MHTSTCLPSNLSKAKNLVLVHVCIWNKTQSGLIVFGKPGEGEKCFKKNKEKNLISATHHTWQLWPKVRRLVQRSNLKKQKRKRDRNKSLDGGGGRGVLPLFLLLPSPGRDRRELEHHQMKRNLDNLSGVAVHLFSNNRKADKRKRWVGGRKLVCY